MDKVMEAQGKRQISLDAAIERIKKAMMPGALALYQSRAMDCYKTIAEELKVGAVVLCWESTFNQYDRATKFSYNVRLNWDHHTASTPTPSELAEVYQAAIKKTQDIIAHYGNKNQAEIGKCLEDAAAYDLIAVPEDSE